MKKLILTSATILFIGLTAFAQDGTKCTKKCDPKECTKKCDTKDNKGCCAYACPITVNCTPENSKECAKKCKMESEKKANNNGTVK